MSPLSRRPPAHDRSIGRLTAARLLPVSALLAISLVGCGGSADAPLDDPGGLADAGDASASEVGSDAASDTSANDATSDAVSDANASDVGSDAVSDTGASDATTDAGEAAAPDATSDAPATCPATATTDGVACTYQNDAYNASGSVKTNSTSAWSCSSGQRHLTANGIPDHAVGTFPNANCPNTIAARSLTAAMTLTPASTGTAARIGVVGYAFNGVKFDPSTAGTCTVSGGTASCSLIGNTGSWNIEALGQSSFNFGTDANNAHVQPTGDYHYHGMPEGILSGQGKGQAMTLVGFALDGFPVYARYGLTDANDLASGVKVVTGSYRVKSAPDAARPSTATYPMGAFTQDYEYVAGAGDLDECNGRTGVTPEFPCGIYHYYITDTFPFLQRCVKGTASGGGPPPGDGGAGTDAGGTCGSCQTNSVCCSAGPCAGSCVPDCRLGPGCPNGLSCNGATGVCG